MQHNLDSPRRPPENTAADTRRTHLESMPYAMLLLDGTGHIVFHTSEAVDVLATKSNAALQGRRIDEFIPLLALPLDGPHDDRRADAGPHAREPQWQVLQTTSGAISGRINRLIVGDQPHFCLELRKEQTDTGDAALRNLMRSLALGGEIAMITDLDGRIEFVNQAFVRHSGFRNEEALGQTLSLLGADEMPELYAQMWATLRAGKPFRATFVNRHKNGHAFYEERSARPFVDPPAGITHYIFTGNDVSDREHVIQRLEHLANHDPLTGLPNRNLFMDRLRHAATHAVRRHGGFALLLLDLDRFKEVNDRFGHAAGDALLIAVANRLGLCVRAEDTVARFGGDEFAVILYEIGRAEDALVVLDKIMEGLRLPYVLDNLQLPTLASVGVALYPEDSVGIEALLKQADTAMYQAKNIGGNAYRFFRQRGTPLRLQERSA